MMIEAGFKFTYCVHFFEGREVGSREGIAVMSSFYFLYFIMFEIFHKKNVTGSLKLLDIFWKDSKCFLSQFLCVYMSKSFSWQICSFHYIFRDD